MNGNVLWETEVQNSDFATFTGLAESADGDIYVVGYTYAEIDDTQQTQAAFPLSDDGYNEYYEDYFGSYEETYAYETQAYVVRLDSDGNTMVETVITDNVAGSDLWDAVYLENVGCITTYTTYTTDNTITAVYALCLDENCKPVWKTVLNDNAVSPYLTVWEDQLYVCLQNDIACTIHALADDGSVSWSQTYEDDHYVTILSNTPENQIIIARTDECFTINPADGSIGQYLWENEVGIIYTTYVFDDYCVVYSDHICGGYYDGFVRMGDLYEYVYAAYDYDGNLLWRKGFTY